MEDKIIIDDVLIKKVQLKDLRNGEFFTLNPHGRPEENQVWVRGEYLRGEGLYSCTRYSDVCDERFFNGNRIVCVNFEF